METASDAPVLSDATDSPSRAITDFQGKAKRPDKQLYVPRQKREEPAEPDSPSVLRGDNEGGENRQRNANKLSKGGCGQTGKSDYSSQQRNRDSTNRKPRGGNNENRPRSDRKTGGGESASDLQQNQDSGKQKGKRPGTGGGSHAATSSSPAARTFHNSSGGGGGSVSNSARRPTSSYQAQSYAGDGGRGSVRAKASGKFHVYRGTNTWNEEGDEYFEEDYEADGNGKSYSRSSRYNNNNEDDSYGDRKQQQHQRRGQPGRRPGQGQQSSMGRFQSERSKADEEALAAQLPDLLGPMPPPLSSASSSGGRTKQQQSNRGGSIKYNQSRRDQQQQQQKFSAVDGRNSCQFASSSAKSQSHASYHDSGEARGSGGMNDYGVFQEDDQGHGHRGGLLFVGQASQQTNDDARQQMSPHYHDEPSPFQSHTFQVEIDETEKAVLFNFQNSGLNLDYTAILLNRLRHLYANALLSDSTIFLEKNRDQNMWNGVFYKLYSILRYNLIELQQARFAPSILGLVDDTARFYQDMCEKLADKYHVNVENSIAEVKKHGEKKSSKGARLLLQRLYISLGDLSRYRCSCGGQAGEDAEMAQRHYETAQRLAPKNSHPYNQLAVLALMTKRRLDAVYYFSRVLAASNPILSVSENLMAIFNEACRRAESDQAYDEDSERDRRQSTSVGIDSRRSEVWVSPDGRRIPMSGAPCSELDDTKYSSIVQRLPLSQLSLRLVDSILNVHGRLFSKVGLDAMPDAVSRCLFELEAALSVNLSLLSPARLIQLTLLNFFSAWRTSTDSSSSRATGNKSLTETFAVEFVLDCAALTIRHARNLFVEKQFDNLRRIMPCVKLYCDWLLYNRTLWNPPPCALDPSTCPEDLDLFSQIAAFANITANCDVSMAAQADPRSASGAGDISSEMAVPVRLEEDEIVAGFAPFTKIRLGTYETEPGTDPSTASFAARLQRFRTLTDYLCGIKSPLLEFNLDTNTFRSLGSTVCRSEKASQPTNVPAGSLPPPLFDFPPQRSQQPRSPSTTSSGVESELDAMRRRRQDLMAEADRRKAEEDYRRELLMREEQQGVAAGNIVMEVQPLILVLDTNSIVDYLPAIRYMIELNRFTIVLPLIVISELDALSVGPRGAFGGHFVNALPPSDEERNDEHVARAAREALIFFDSQFNRRNQRIKAMTSDGNFVDTIGYRDQLLMNNGAGPTTNDDIILKCALHYCNEQRDRQAMAAAASGSGTVIIREVVLVTCDRNLRIKAHLNRVPSCPMRTLLKWAKIPVSGR